MDELRKSFVALMDPLEELEIDTFRNLADLLEKIPNSETIFERFYKCGLKILDSKGKEITASPGTRNYEYTNYAANISVRLEHRKHSKSDQLNVWYTSKGRSNFFNLRRKSDEKLWWMIMSSKEQQAEQEEPNLIIYSDIS